MRLNYSRSSSINNFSFCQMQYYLTYNLGFIRPANKKADMGSAVHKVLEWLAIGKKFIQDNPDCENIKIEDYTISKKDMFSESYLTDSQVDAINKSRTSKSIYKHEANIAYGSSRIGKDVVKFLIDESTKYYSSKSKDEWAKCDFRDCENWTWMALEYNDGRYDPRYRNIHSPERAFDLEIKEDWAKLDDGSFFKIKGTIDLVTELSGNVLEIIDWKTGQRYDWANGEVKTYSKLCNDTQLMLYHYAASELFPTYDAVVITIFFVRDGGPFTICFDLDNKDKIKNRLREHFDEVRNTKIPKMCHPNQNDFKCQKLCPFFKEEWNGTGLNTCRFIHKEIKRIGIDKVDDLYKNPDHSIDSYKAPGE